MRKLMAMAIILMMSSTSSWALFGLEDISYDGSLEVSSKEANNEVDRNDSGATSDRNSQTNTRVRQGINLMVTESVKGRLEIVRTGRTYGSGATTVAGEEGMWSFQEAYVEFENVIGGIGAKLGRQYVGNAGDLVWNFSPTDDDSLSVAALDGITLYRNFSEDMVNVNLFLGKASEDDALANTDADDGAGDINLNSLDVLFNLSPAANINAGYLWGTDKNTSSSADSNKLKTYRLGIRGQIAEGFFTYRAEYFQNAGSSEAVTSTADLDYAGFAFDLGAGVNVSETEVGGFAAEINYLFASGDDNVNDGDDDSFHDFSALGLNSSDRLLGEIFGKSNSLTAGSSGTKSPVGQGLDTGVQGQGLQVFHIGGAYTPPVLDNRLTARLDFFTFNTAEDGTRSKVPNADKYGTEIDFTLAFQHSENVGIDLGYANFSPDDAVVGTATNTPDDNVTKFFARGKVKWGGDQE